MLPDCIRMVLCVSILTDQLTYRVWSGLFVIQLLRRSFVWKCCTGRQTLSQISRTTSLPPALFRLMGLIILQGLMECLVSLLQASCEGGCVHFRFQTTWLLRGLQWHHWIIAVISTEWSHPCRGQYRIIVSEFS